MQTAIPPWIDGLMRFGYSARGGVYLLVGALAFVAALDGGRTPDSMTALGSLLTMPFGKALLALIALGLASYAAYRFIGSVFNVSRDSRRLRAWAARGAQLISGALHLSLGLSVARLAMGDRTDGGDRTDEWTAVLMQQPAGRWLVAGIGLIALALAVQHFVKAFRETYKRHIRRTEATERLAPVLKLGLVAHGFVIAVVGVFFVWAAWTADPERAGGLGDALRTVRAADGGDLLFTGVGVGLLSFAVYCFIVAVYGIVAGHAPPDLQALSSKTRELARTMGDRWLRL